MKSMLPSPEELRYFIEVADTENLTRAAARLGVTQPSLSLALNRLEHSVGTQLLVRGKKGVRLTAAGKKILSDSQDLLNRWTQLKLGALHSQDQIEGHIRIGCHPSVAIYSLPDTLKRLYKKYPKLNVRLVHDLSRRITEKVIQFELEVGIVINPVEHPDLVCLPINKDDVGFWMAANGDEETLIYDPDLIQAQQLILKVKKNQNNFKREIHSSNLEVIKELVASGCGVGILPGRVVSSGVSRPMKLLKDYPSFKDELHIVYRVENKDRASTKALVHELRHP